VTERHLGPSLHPHPSPRTLNRVSFLMRPILLIAAIALAPTRVPPLEIVDEGSFVLYLNGQRIGREQFSIKRNAGADGVTLLARATITFDGRRIESMLRTDTTGLPLEFTIEDYVEGKLRSRVNGGMVGPRFVQRSSHGGSQSEKEVRLARGTVMADSESVYQFYFVARSRGLARVQLLFPRRLTRDSVSITVRSENQEVELGNGKVPARHLIVTDAAGIATDVWLDANGRLLRVAVQSRGFVAVRDAPPA
jgi:hypothetical protein